MNKKYVTFEEWDSIENDNDPWEEEELADFKEWLGKRLNSKHTVDTWWNYYMSWEESNDDYPERPDECKLTGVPGNWCPDCPYCGCCNYI